MKGISLLKKIMKYSLLFLFILNTQISYSQNDWRVYNEQNTPIENTDTIVENDFILDTEGSVSIFEDPRIDSLLWIIAENPPEIKGYRVEIFFGNRKDADKVKGDFLKEFDQYPIYIIWQQPNFKIHVGNFLTKLQAEKAQQEIKYAYPNSYIVITEIKATE